MSFILMMFYLIQHNQNIIILMCNQHEINIKENFILCTKFMKCGAFYTYNTSQFGC